MMNNKFSVVFVDACPKQNEAIVNVIRNNFPVWLSGNESDLAILIRKVKLLVHAEAGFSVSGHELNAALESSPVILSNDGRVALLSGANEVTACLSLLLSNYLKRVDSAMVLIPHEYAREDEIGSLSSGTDVSMLSIGGVVYWKFDSMSCLCEEIIKSLGTTISMFSKIWVFKVTHSVRRLKAVLVPIFDGDGWSIVGDIED